MPRDGSNVYSVPAGTSATTNTTIESAKYNAFVSDVETDLNTPRPIVAGGTGASSASAARTALGLAIGTDVQAYDAELAAIAALAVTDGNVIVGNGTTWVAESGATARASLGLAIGTDVQAYDAELAAIAGLTSAANKVPMFSGSGTATLLDFKDEDNMASDSATAVPSQQSVKAYVDALNIGGVTLLGTLTTTSGASQSLTSLDLSDYKFVVAFWNQVSGGNNPSVFEFPEASCSVITTTAAVVRGFTIIDLATGVGFSSLGVHNNPAPSSAVADTTDGIVSIASNLSTASTTISVSVTSGALDGGSIKVYGVK